ncbi:hypothetical protein [Streptomyces mesophilus]|uniref:hypothetical protein n=1 Tax=Streptomyces mesophilus TaxID=1775132 RepID=UPI00332713A8
MPAAPARRLFAVPLLVGVLLAVVGVLCGASAAAPASSSSFSSSSSYGASAAVTVVDDALPGCGESDPAERGSQPAAPSRGTGAQELLAGQAAAPAGLADCGAFVGVTPERGPPPGDPPTPVTLSVLRV